MRQGPRRKPSPTHRVSGAADEGLTAVEAPVLLRRQHESGNVVIDRTSPLPENVDVTPRWRAPARYRVEVHRPSA